MRDDQLLADLEPMLHTAEAVASLKEHGITTYTGLFHLLRDENANSKARYHGAYALGRLHDFADKRRAVPALLVALRAIDEEVRATAAFALSMFRSQRAVLSLIEVAADRNQSDRVRLYSIQALASIGDERALPHFRRIMFDPTETVMARSQVIEWSQQDLLEDWITLLADPVVDVRFWAAYRLATSFDDISPALKALDHVVAYDHNLPLYGLWHNDREALLPLETIYYHQVVSKVVDEDGDWHYPPCCMYLVSPAAEYSTFTWKFLEYQPDSSPKAKPLPPVTLNIDPLWLAKRLQDSWPGIELNTRQPRPEAYLLDWKLVVDGETLIGGLHRDQYALVLTGEDKVTFAFMAWYRNLLAPEQALYFYEWADVHVTLRPGMTADDVAEAFRLANTGEKRALNVIENFPG